MKRPKLLKSHSRLGSLLRKSSQQRGLFAARTHTVNWTTTHGIVVHRLHLSRIDGRGASQSLTRPVTEADLIRFVNAQADVYNQVVQELSEGRKQSHWMWFIFSQVAGLGHSSMAHYYAIRDLNQAKRYLADPLLGSRLREDVRLMMRHKGKSAFEILGSPDDLKFRSCLTLFAQAASMTPTARYSRRLWTSSMVARRILEHWSCYARPRLEISRPEAKGKLGLRRAGAG